ncbi:M15 family metallopeptidase [Sabulibacter ruber]|uniref:M15 family metallopeptidase n=1 Tax=Sabulibacter ruber TaxID=2811901 RepID=UPI001A96479C|nr:M15 family metallopeptidase [Sabulibacter ruber]
MAADLNLLVPEFRDKVLELLDKCLERGIEMRPNEGIRDPFKQGIYWRQSRTKEQVYKEINRLKDQGADFLAYCIESVGPRSGRHVTNTIPGVSWHQWGEALDCFWVLDGKAEWSLKKTVGGLNGYMVYASEAKKLGLDAGLYWTFVDGPHVQLRSVSNASHVYSIQRINNEMQIRFGES